MNWQFSRSIDAIKKIEQLPFAGQVALFEYIDELEADPFRVTEPYGEDDGVTRLGVFGNGFGLIALIVGSETRRLTPLQINWVDPL
ncbi:hypothetical protein ACWDXD_19960 [Streptomyces sp. NPDC003314]